MTAKQRFRLPAIAAQLLLGIPALALITFVCFRLGLGLAVAAFGYMILTVLLSLLGSVSASVVLSILAAACLNFFFAPPLFEFRIDAVVDTAAVVAFLTTSLVVTGLTAKRRRVEEELGASKTRLEAAQRIAQVGWWERDGDFSSAASVDLSEEACRILGVQPPQWPLQAGDQFRHGALRPGANGRGNRECKCGDRSDCQLVPRVFVLHFHFYRPFPSTFVSPG